MPLPYLDTLGLQLWTVRDQMAEAPQATLETLAEIGYKQLELGDTDHLSSLVPMARELGMAVHSSFIPWSALTGRWDLTDRTPLSFEQILDQSEAAGLSHLVFGYLLPEERQSLDDYRRLSDQLNEAGMQAKAHGIRMAYHNHNVEFMPMAGGIPYDVLKERLDPDAFSFELDVFWAAIAGRDPMEELRGLGDRVSLLHLKDLKADTPNLTDMPVPDEAFQELGNGVLDIKGLMQLGHELGVDYCFVEQDESPDPIESTRESWRYLNR